MKISSFEEILAWQKSRQLVADIYKEFSRNNDYGFRDQIQRAAVSVMNNIAEGFERKSNNEFRQFLYIAKGSCGEVRSMLALAEDLRYISPENASLLADKSKEISRMLMGLIKSL